MYILETIARMDAIGSPLIAGGIMIVLGLSMAIFFALLMWIVPLESVAETSLFNWRQRQLEARWRWWLRNDRAMADVRNDEDRYYFAPLPTPAWCWTHEIHELMPHDGPKL